MIDILGAGLLGAHVTRRTDHLAGRRSELAHPAVDDLPPPLGAAEHVMWLQIAVDDPS